MFFLAQLLLKKTSADLPVIVIPAGILLYGLVYLYLLFYQDECTFVFNKFIVYVVGLDLLLSAFYYFYADSGVTQPKKQEIGKCTRECKDADCNKQSTDTDADADADADTDTGSSKSYESDKSMNTDDKALLDSIINRISDKKMDVKETKEPEPETKPEGFLTQTNFPQEQEPEPEPEPDLVGLDIDITEPEPSLVGLDIDITEPSLVGLGSIKVIPVVKKTATRQRKAKKQEKEESVDI